jgi:hypothetical protein
MKLNLKGSILVLVWVLGISFAVGLTGCQKSDSAAAAVTPQTPIGDIRSGDGAVQLSSLVGLYQVIRVNQCTTWDRQNCDVTMVRMWGTIERGLHLEQTNINRARAAIDLDRVTTITGGISAVTRDQNWGRHSIEVVTLVQDGRGAYILSRETMDQGTRGRVEILLRKIR